MKTFILTLSRTFPSTHKRKGEETFFPAMILTGIGKPLSPFITVPAKIHTIRANYDLWKKRIEQVQEGKAILSLRYWLGKAYRSKQAEFCRLDKDSGVGVQQLDFDKLLGIFINSIDSDVSLKVLAKNDGLSLEDFKEWFKKYDLSKTMAIIHFTPFRY